MTGGAEGAGVFLRFLQYYAWLLFLVSWAQMGWVDMVYQKIRNQYVKFWLALVVLAYAGMLVQSALGAFGVVNVFLSRAYFIDLLQHLVLSTAAAYALWRLAIWPAGDVKLFVLLSLCYPLMRIPGEFRSGLLFLEVLINVFIPAALFVFVKAGVYLWRTRFAHYAGHLRSVAKAKAAAWRKPGPAPAPPEAAAPPAAPARKRPMSPAPQGPAAAAPAPSPTQSPLAGWLRERGTDLAGWLRAAGSELGAWLLGYCREPKRFLIDAVTWLAMMGIMSMLSYYLADHVRSHVLKTLICFALMFCWSRICQSIGTAWAFGGMFAVCGLLLWRRPDFDLPAFAAVFGHLTVFSLAIMLGVNFAFKLLAGNSGYLVFAAPLAMMMFGLIPWRAMFSGLWRGVAALGSGVVSAGASISLPSLPPVPRMPEAPELAVPALPALPAMPALPALSAPPWLADLYVWAAMGLFFGVALVFVKIWDAESYRSVPVGEIDPYMNPGPELVARIEADPDLRDEHFSMIYADGLTPDQAKVLREWCREEGLKTVPLAPTISFANWIFLGFFLTRVLQGHVLRMLY